MLFRILIIYLLFWLTAASLVLLITLMISLIKRNPEMFKRAFLLNPLLLPPGRHLHPFRRLWIWFLRLFWEAPQTFAGFLWLNLRNLQGKIIFTDTEDAVTISFSGGRGRGVSFGEFVEVRLPLDKISEIRETGQKCYLVWHEFGHSLDSRRLGPLYLFVVGIPSLISAFKGGQFEKDGQLLNRHSFRSYEIRANRLAANYVRKNYGKDWRPFNDDFPLG